MKLIKRLFWVIPLFIMGVISCKKIAHDVTPETDDPNCDTIIYSTHIKPIFDTHCNGCHFLGGPGPGDFTKLENIQAQKDRIKVRAVIDGTMPASAPIPDDQRELLGFWIDCGALPGEIIPDSISVSYANDIKQIMDSACVVCHNGGGFAPGDFRLYDDVKNAVDNKNLEGRVFVIQDMPQNDTLTVNERQTLKDWLDAGSPNN
ncbi:MAG: hypothetical protein ACPGEG_00400 [Salibacteraceae bacterium]